MEQYTSWKVRVPDCVVFVRNVNTGCACAHTHTQFCTHTFIKIHVHIEVRVRGWVVGCVVGWCGVAKCGGGVLVLGILKLEIGKIQGFSFGEPLKRVKTLF